MRYFPTIILLLFSIATFAPAEEILTTEDAEQFIQALISSGGNPEAHIDSTALTVANRLGIQYQGAPVKFLIQYDLDPSIKRALRAGDLARELEIEPLADGYSQLKILVPSREYEQTFYFRGKQLSSPADYYTRHWQQTESKYFHFRISDSSDFNSYAAGLLDAFTDSLINRLQYSGEKRELLQKKKIIYLLCHNTDEMKDITSFESRGIYLLANDYIVSTFNNHQHEVAHLLINFKLQKLPLYTHPLFQEGFACAMGGRGGKSPQVINEIGAFLQQSGFLKYSEIISLQQFQDNNPSLSYPLSGIFNRFLLDSWPLKKYLAFYRKHSGTNTRHRGRTLTLSQLPDSSEFMNYLSEFNQTAQVTFPEIPDAQPILSGDWGKIWESESNYIFRLKGGIRLTPPTPFKHFNSQEFAEIFPDTPYRNEQYLLEMTADEVKLFNLYSATLDAFYSNGLSTEIRQIKNTDDMFEFAISKDIFPHPLSAFTIR